MKDRSAPSYMPASTGVRQNWRYRTGFRSGWRWGFAAGVLVSVLAIWLYHALQALR